MNGTNAINSCNRMNNPANVDAMNETDDFTSDGELWLSPAEAGKLFPGGLAASTVREWCHAGRFLGAFQTPTGRWRIPASAVARVAGGAA